MIEARAAIVFEWFQKYGGNERVIAEARDMFPDADLFALVHDAKTIIDTPLDSIPVRTSFIQSLPRASEKYRLYLPLMPLAVEQLDLRPYDFVLSVSHTVAKGVLTRPDQLHVSYTLTPVRYAWDLYLDYLYTSDMNHRARGLLARLVLHYLRLWDVSSANRVDAYLAISSYVAERIRKLYRRPAQVIYPPVDVASYRHDLPREEFSVTVLRFVPYKRLDLIVEAFSRMRKPLVVIGGGPEQPKVKRIAGPSIKLLGYQPDEIVDYYLQRARAFVFAADEDFGIAPIEAQAAGCPIIAYGKGGVLETVVGWPAHRATGVFFNTQTAEALQAAVDLFETREHDFSAENCRRNAERFKYERFRRDFNSTIEDLWNKFQHGEELEQGGE